MQTKLKPHHYLIVGANSSIAISLIKHLINQDTSSQIRTVSRTPLALSCPSTKSKHFICDNQEASVKAILDQLREENYRPTRIFILNGKLHDDAILPEKQIDAFNGEHFLNILSANTLTPIIWIKYMKPLLPKDSQCVITCLSARVGSISDNKMGGWYSYRASKAALNMLLKTTSLELSRNFPRLKCVAYHPGTVDTPLSKPFQSGIKHKTLSSEQAALYLYNNTSWLKLTKTFNYIDWQGQNIDY